MPTDIVPAIDLRESCDSRCHFVASWLACVVAFEVLREERPWPDEAHMPLKHVHKLGQFVEARTPEPPTELREPVGIAQESTVDVARFRHAAKFNEPERLPMPS